MKNPLLDEGQDVFISSKEYLKLHAVYVGVIVVFTFLLWPSQSFMSYFRTESIPAMFQAVVVFQLISSAGLSLYAGLDRLAEKRLIKYSEWLERTDIPVRTLMWGKVLTGTLHSVFLVALGFPSVIIAAGPAGIPMPAVLASEAVVVVTVIVCRVAGLLVSHVGEFRYVVRVVGGWLFGALLFVATIQLAPAINPIIAVTRQQAEGSPLMMPGAVTRLTENPLVSPMIGLTIVGVILLVIYGLSLTRHRQKSQATPPAPGGSQ